MQSRAIRRPEVMRITGLSATSIYELEKRGEFPRHWLMTPRCAVWDEDEVRAFVDARRAQPAAPSVVPDQSKRKNRPGRGKAAPASSWPI